MMPVTGDRDGKTPIELGPVDKCVKYHLQQWPKVADNMPRKYFLIGNGIRASPRQKCSIWVISWSNG